MNSQIELSPPLDDVLSERGACFSFKLNGILVCIIINLAERQYIVFQWGQENATEFKSCARFRDNKTDVYIPLGDDGRPTIKIDDIIIIFNDIVKSDDFTPGGTRLYSSKEDKPYSDEILKEALNKLGIK